MNLRILPATAGSGVVFRRTDLDSFELEAVSKNVARVSYATSLMKKGVFISDDRTSALRLDRLRHRQCHRGVG